MGDRDKMVHVQRLKHFTATSELLRSRQEAAALQRPRSTTSGRATKGCELPPWAAPGAATADAPHAVHTATM